MRSIVEQNIVMRRTAVFVNVGVKPASPSAFGLLLSRSLSRPPYLTGSTITRSSGNVKGATGRCPSPFGEDVASWFQRGRASERYRDGQQWFNAAYPGKWTGRGGTIRWHPRPTAETPMGYFRVWTPERAGLHSPFQDCVRPLGKNEGSCDVCLMPTCKVRRTATCLAANESTFEHSL